MNFAVALVVGLALADVAAAQSSCQIPRADDFDDGVLDTNLWSPFAYGGGSLAEAFGLLIVDVPGPDSGAGLALACRWEGDFDAAVDYQIINAFAPNDFKIVLAAYSQNVATCERTIGFSCPTCDDHVANLNGVLSASPTTMSGGKLRLVRHGSVVTALAWDGIGWSEIASAPIDSTPVTIQIWAFATSFPGSRGTIAFDNFRAVPPATTDSFDGNAIDPGQWTVVTSPSSTVGETAGQVLATVNGPNAQAGLVWRGASRGDFDARVAFAIAASPAASDFRVEVAAVGGPTVSVEHATGATCGMCRDWLVAFDAGVTTQPTLATSGTLRLTRAGDVVEGWFGNGPSWVSIGSATVPGLPRDVSIRVRAFTGVSSGAAGSVAFDDFAVAALVAPEDPARTGRFDVLPYDSQILAVMAATLRTGKVLYVAGSGNDPNNLIFSARVWNPVTGEITPFTLERDLFCAGLAFQGNGTVLFSGGTAQYDPFFGLRDTTEFDPISETFEREDGADMALGRWYPSNLALPDGRVLVMSGLDDVSGATNRTVEIYSDDTGRWDAPTHVPDAMNLTLFPWLHVTTAGEVIHTGRSTDTWIMNPATRQWRQIANSNFGLRDYGNSVFLPLNPPAYDQRFLIAGGTDYCAGGLATASAEILDLDRPAPAWRWIEPMCCPRVDGMSVILPDCSVLTQGGSLFKEAPSTGTLTAELFDPASETWTRAASSTIPRVYHSVAALLPDGRVWIAGSNPDRGDDEMRMEVYSPPYLFKGGSRPRIVDAPAVVQYGQTFTIDVQGGPLARVRMMRPTACTHSTEFEQRCVGATVVAGGAGNGPVTLVAPPNPNVAPPGYYMMFAIDSRLVPSEAAWVRLVPDVDAPEFAARRGNVNRGASSTPANVISINGQTGDSVAHVVRIAPGPATLSVALPPGGGRGQWALWIGDGEATSGSVANAFLRSNRGPEPLGLATFCLPVSNSVSPGACPCPPTFSTGFTSERLGVHGAANLCLRAQSPRGPAPASFTVDFPPGTYTVQGVIVDPRSPNAPRTVSLTNALTVEVLRP
ncbi:MAG: DUF1929 domain-containing protein [Planctomycetes bacterium]|nr:DUF1929 domain-containing protein [Planctomycetota bacterium]